MLFWIFSEKHCNNFVNSSEFLCFQKKNNNNKAMVTQSQQQIQKNEKT